jgi:ubiquinol oxidase
MPYFTYITMLHLYETLGFWRRSSDVKRIHFAEEMNEFRHLLIMESLGGDQPWWVRFVAQHSAIAYFIILCVLWGISPSLSYNFSELLETHAVNTYGQFLDENESKLKELPPSIAAVEYYSLGAADPFYAEIQTVSSQAEESREVRCFDFVGWLHFGPTPSLNIPNPRRSVHQVKI